MKLTIEPTPEIINVEGGPVRVWKGHDENGTEVHALVRAVSPQTHDEDRLRAYESELNSLPTLTAGAIDYRFIAD